MTEKPTWSSLVRKKRCNLYPFHSCLNRNVCGGWVRGIGRGLQRTLDVIRWDHLIRGPQMVKCTKGQVWRLKTALHWKGNPELRQRIQMVIGVPQHMQRATSLWRLSPRGS